MAVIHYVGFNGYKQCPVKEPQDLPKIIEKWIPLTWKKIKKVCCTHKFTVIETEKEFSFRGFIQRDKSESFSVHKPMLDVDGLCCDDECLVAGENTRLWKLTFEDSKWTKLDLNFEKNQKRIWDENGNKVLKITYRTDLKNFIILMNNGSVWELARQEHLKLLFPHDVDKAVDVASGLEHTLILTESGCVLSFGNGSRGQLGTGNLEYVEQPVQLSSLEGLKVSKISAGHWHSCAVTDSGDLCSWGWNNCGQLAAFEDGEEVGLSSLPIFVDVGNEGDESVVDVACGGRHTVAKLDNGNLYATGWNAYGQLGIQSSFDQEKVTSFTVSNIKGNQNRKLLAGPWYTVLLENEPESTT